jgi:hypothetical protein
MRVLRQARSIFLLLASAVLSSCCIFDLVLHSPFIVLQPPKPPASTFISPSLTAPLLASRHHQRLAAADHPGRGHRAVVWREEPVFPHPGAVHLRHPGAQPAPPHLAQARVALSHERAGGDLGGGVSRRGLQDAAVCGVLPLGEGGAWSVAPDALTAFCAITCGLNGILVGILVERCPPCMCDSFMETLALAPTL